ncbi:unnamed protein product [Nippostrongylus brasiliensis]|uniref:CVNH domain-containing protein n=1 Tax=Nippostrongylus brasiliensis TaxID=27835 RepID=A0A0N4Y6S5_NIPBR|nr:unnamed protein product [Nippostrongylus brasiliensis]
MGTHYQLISFQVENGTIRLKCSSSSEGWKVDILGCMIDQQLVDVGGTKSIGNILWNCKKHPNGTVLAHAAIKDRAFCDGHNIGETWWTSVFKLKCGNRGTSELLGCEKSGIFIETHNIRNVGNHRWKCWQDANGRMRLDRV